MKTSLEWLSEFLPDSPAGPLDADIAADVLLRGGLPVEQIEAHGADRVLDVEVTSNRADCLSHVGVARELAALLDRPFKDLSVEVKESETTTASVTSVQIDSADLCPHYMARIIRNVKIGESPDWLKRRLESIGVRAINNIVDVTNYVMFELGHPLHAFDFDTLSGKKIIVRTARPGETITSIDGHERKLSKDMLVIADVEKPVALAGVMGGLASEVSDKTVNVLLESARFDPLSIRRTARALAMKSDSSYRYERGIDPTLTHRASLRAAQLILQTAGGELLSGVAEAGSDAITRRQITLRLERMKRLLGTDIAKSDALAALKRLQLSPVQQGDGAISVTVPSWRSDLTIEADLIEEVARLVGYDKIPVRETISINVAPPSPEARSMELIRSTLVSAGFYEAVTFTFVSDALAGDFVRPEHTGLPRADSAVRKADAQLRPSLLPGLLESVRRNEANGTSGAKLFETGSTFGVDAAGKMHEVRRLGLVGDDNLRDLRGAVEAVLSKLDAARTIAVIPDKHPGYADGAYGRIEWGGKPIGHLGRVDKKVTDKLSLREIPTAAELDLPPLISGTQHVPQLRPLPRFPAIRRDLSLVVADAMRYESLEALVRKLQLPSLEEVEYVTTYRGKPLEKGSKSLTITLVFRSPTTTLTSEQVETSVQRVIETAGNELNAKLRA